MEMPNLRGFKEGDEVRILDLFKLVFKKGMSKEFWNWRFKSNVLKEVQLQLVEVDTAIVAHYAVCPVEFLVEGHLSNAALSMTTMTHPEHNGKGYFKQTANALYGKMLNENYSFIYGFPNLNSHYGFKKSLGWFDIERIPTLQISSERLQLSSSNTSIAFHEIYAFDESHTLLCQKYTAEYKFKLNRNAAYLNWRYNEHPENKYFAFGDENGFVVYKKFLTPNGVEIDICELMVPSDETYMLNMLQRIINSNASARISAINLWMPMTDARHLLLEKIGFGFSGQVTILAYRPLVNELSVSLSDWYYSFGDSDIY
jgi:hypothetical protein